MGGEKGYQKTFSFKVSIEIEKGSKYLYYAFHICKMLLFFMSMVHVTIKQKKKTLWLFRILKIKKKK